MLNVEVVHKVLKVAANLIFKALCSEMVYNIVFISLESGHHRSNFSFIDMQCNGKQTRNRIRCTVQVKDSTVIAFYDPAYF